MFFEVRSKDVSVLPIQCHDAEETRVRSEAMGRQRIRMMRRQLQVLYTHNVVQYDASKAKLMIYTNIAELLTLFAGKQWETAKDSRRPQVAGAPPPDAGIATLRTCSMEGQFFVQLVADVAAPPSKVFSFLHNTKTRPLYDPLCEAFDPLERIDHNNVIVHLKRGATNVAGMAIPAIDFLLLRSSRAPTLAERFEDRRRWIIAHRSVLLEQEPPHEGYVRQQTLSSGFVIAAHPGDDKACTVTYILNTSGQIFKYISGDVIGASRELEGIFHLLKKQVEEAS